MASKPESKKYAIICPPQKHCISKVLKNFNGRNFHWAYFGEDISKFLHVDQQIGNLGRNIDSSAKLQEIAHSLRQPYIDYIGKLSLENNSLEWWSRYFSEKNPFESKIFLYSCYVKVCQDILKSYDQNNCVVIFVENSALQRCFIQNLENFSGYELNSIESFRDSIFNVLKDVYNLISKRLLFIIYNISKILYIKYIFNNKNKILLKEGQQNTFILTWMDSRSFDENGKYHDTYFRDLPLKLKERGKTVIIVPYILENYIKYIKTIQSEEKILVPEYFLNAFDILRVTIRELTAVPRKKNYPQFQNLEISRIIFDEYKRNWIEIRTTSLLLFYEIVKHWKIARIPIDVFIFTFENHIRDKILSIALRQFYPNTYIIGYQHATVSTMYLDHFFSKEELNILPLPDRLVTNGKFYERLFRESGYPFGKVDCCGAIRYSNLLKSFDGIHHEIDSGRSPTILVTPSTNMNDAAELVWKVIKAFEHSKEYRILIKCHPDMPFQRFSKKLSIPSLPLHFNISTKPVHELLKESDVLIYTTTTTCVEALAFGVPTLHVESDFIIDMDILDFKPDIRYSARNKDTIREQVEQILRIERKDLLEKRRQWKETALEIFGPINEHTYDLFLRPK